MGEKGQPAPRAGTEKLDSPPQKPGKRNGHLVVADA